MKKGINYLLPILILALLFTGCGKGTAIPSTDTSPAPSESAAAATPTPSPVICDTNIPDIQPAPEEYMNVTNHEVAEDDNNIYLQQMPEEGSPRLYAISKTTGEITRLIDNCYNFAYGNGIIYWIQANPVDNSTNTINKYDIKAGASTPVSTLDKDAFSLMLNGKQLYLIYAKGENADGEPFTALYSMGTDGSEFKETLNNVAEAGMYKNKIYFATNGTDGSTVHQYDPATGKQKQLTSASAAGFYFDIAQGKLFFCGMEEGPQEGLCMADTASGETVKFTDDATQEFTVLGQYFFYIAAEDSSRVLTAYDISTGKHYKLVDVTNLLADESTYASLRATDKNAYLNIENADGTFTLYRITIQGGKGKLVKATK